MYVIYTNFEVHMLARLDVALLRGRLIWLGDPHDILVIPVNIAID